MWSVLKGLPIATPLKVHFKFLGSILHGLSHLRVVLPVPTDLTIDPRGNINSMTSKMPRVHCLGSTFTEQLFLTLDVPKTLNNCEVLVSNLDSPLDYLDQIRVNSLKIRRRSGDWDAEALPLPLAAA
jgi:hypothetical protein